jgi:hypothetical protein
VIVKITIRRPLDSAQVTVTIGKSRAGDTFVILETTGIFGKSFQVAAEYELLAPRGGVTGS